MVSVPAGCEDAEPAPYRGLSRFEPGDRELFFGRDRLVNDLVSLTGRHRVVHRAQHARPAAAQLRLDFRTFGLRPARVGTDSGLPVALPGRGAAVDAAGGRRRGEACRYLGVLSRRASGRRAAMGPVGSRCPGEPNREAVT
ncbi:nSTAND1 domain-containing NTPase [Streptomyces bambusae]|uniref:nSTAND1 domain-containing NTPase n=1 Tax=Streptomyces bambusae TaxID=1550616 RepID=UPI003557EF3D